MAGVVVLVCVVLPSVTLFSYFDVPFLVTTVFVRLVVLPPVAPDELPEAPLVSEPVGVMVMVPPLLEPPLEAPLEEPPIEESPIVLLLEEPPTLLSVLLAAEGVVASVEAPSVAPVEAPLLSALPIAESLAELPVASVEAPPSVPVAVPLPEDPLAVLPGALLEMVGLLVVSSVSPPRPASI